MSAAEQIKQVRQRIASACQQSGRDSRSVMLLAVSKTFPLEDVLQLAQCGQTAFGENYLQEALGKITQLAEIRLSSPGTPQIHWHFIGPIQSNKTRPIAEHFDWVHSVDRLKIAQRLSEQRPTELPPLQVLLQVNTSGEASKSGVAPTEVLPLCKAISQLPRLELRGLMTIPSPTDDADTLRREFNECKALLEQARELGVQMDVLSMGMSADLETAIECGSTCVRVGSALFGQRPANNQQGTPS